MSKLNQIAQEPIFIVGFPRSGTTYLQSLMCTQPGIISFPETHFFNKAVGHYDDDQMLTKRELDEVIKVLRQKNDIPFKIDRLNIENETGSIYQKNIFESWLIQLAELQKVDLRNRNILWVEKTPAHAMFLHKIFKFYPKAKVISMVRNPLFSINSYFNKLVEYRKPYHDLAEIWKSIYDSIEEAENIFKDQVLTVKYEDLSRNQSDEMKKIGQFIGRDINMDLLSSYGGEAKKLVVDNEPWKNSNTKSSEFQETKKHKIPVKSILQIEYLLKPYFIKFGYSLEHSGKLALYSKYRNLRS